MSNKLWMQVYLVLFMLVMVTSCVPVPEAVAFATPEEQAAIATSAAVQIPEALIQFFNGVVIALFTAGFVWVWEKFGLDLRQYAIPLAGTLATWVVTELQGYINTIPDFQDVYLNLLFRILLALVPAFGLLRIFARQPATLLEHNVPNRAR